ncbi:hypothetical protein QFZ33_002354 [Arthrobacter globiformis]|nr:hypothetical protein [Arthrobacter globiformis]
MKKRNFSTLHYAQSKSLTVATGEHCPETGWWHPVQPEKPGTPAPPRFVGEGSVMPAVGGTSTIWVPAGTV